LGKTATGSPCLRAFKSAAAGPKPHAAGVVVVGNELLNGKVHDTNAHHLCGELHARGIVVKCVEVVPDDVEAIARCVGGMAIRCDFVFTSGGLGPTHDDKTMAGIAAAFNVGLVEDKRLYAMLASAGAKRGARGNAAGVLDASGGKINSSSEPMARQPTPSTEAAYRKMASLPRGALVEWPDDGNPWPVVSMRNVYIFAGLPTAFRQMFGRAARDGRFEGARRWLQESVWLDAEEEEVPDALQSTVDGCPLVEIGSYPAAAVVGRQRLNIVLEAFDPEHLAAARAHLLGALPAALVVADSGGAAAGEAAGSPAK